MYTFAVVLHVIVCFLMIAAILLQGGKGAEIGAAFGGSSQTVFGSRGPANFLSKVTVATAVIFMLTSLSLAYLSRQNVHSSTILDLDKRDAATAPATPPDQESEESESEAAAPSEEAEAPPPAEEGAPASR